MISRSITRKAGATTKMQKGVSSLKKRGSGWWLSLGLIAVSIVFMIIGAVLVGLSLTQSAFTAVITFSDAQLTNYAESLPATASALASSLVSGSAVSTAQTMSGPSSATTSLVQQVAIATSVTSPNTGALTSKRDFIRRDDATSNFTVTMSATGSANVTIANPIVSHINDQIIAVAQRAAAPRGLVIISLIAIACIAGLAVRFLERLFIYNTEDPTKEESNMVSWMGPSIKRFFLILHFLWSIVISIFVVAVLFFLSDLNSSVTTKLKTHDFSDITNSHIALTFNSGSASKTISSAMVIISLGAACAIIEQLFSFWSEMYKVKRDDKLSHGDIEKRIPKPKRKIISLKPLAKKIEESDLSDPEGDKFGGMSGNESSGSRRSSPSIGSQMSKRSPVRATHAIGGRGHQKPQIEPEFMSEESGGGKEGSMMGSDAGSFVNDEDEEKPPVKRRQEALPPSQAPAKASPTSQKKRVHTPPAAAKAPRRRPGPPRRRQSGMEEKMKSHTPPAARGHDRR